MEICIFYSWQSKYRENCDKIIGKALNDAIKEINKEQDDYHYYIERGGGDVLGAEHIDNNIDEIINTRADLAFVDFTHNGVIPQQNPESGEWVKQKCLPNTNAAFENGKLENALNPRQVFKVYNTAYGDLETNLEMPFDLRQEHFPIPFWCDDSTDDDSRKKTCDGLKKRIKTLIKKGTTELMNNQKVRYAPLIPMRNEYTKKLYSSPFKETTAFANVLGKVNAGNSFRLLGLPGLGKTRMVGETFRGRDNDVYYCDCKEQQRKDVINAVERLLARQGKRRQTVILDNCDQRLCGQVNDTINESGYNCQLITIHYDPGERTDSGIEGIPLKVEDFAGVVEDMVEQVNGMPKDVKEAIISLAGGFPLMATFMIDNFRKGDPIVNISKKDVFERMLGVDSQNANDQDKLKVLTAFSIFKFIGLYGQQEKQGRFIAGNKIITNLRGTEEENLQLFRVVYGQYQKVEILERQGNLVLMRLIPLAIYLCKEWFDIQTTDSIAMLIDQIRNCPDEGTRNMLIESLSRRITLLSGIPLAKDLNDGLTDPDHSPFLTEEVVLSALGSRLFLAFSEVNPESCAFALQRMIVKKSNEEILALNPARRNLAWALDHLAFDKRSFRNAMLTLARLSLLETEENLSNNTTGLFIDRFAVLLPGTEVNLESRIHILTELSTDPHYDNLVKKALIAALHSGDFYRSGGAEKQGIKTLKDYVPSFQEISSYYNACLDMLLSLAKTSQDIEEIAKALANNARSYYLHGAESFLFRGLEVIAPKKDYVWEEMKDALTFLIVYDAKKRKNYRIEDIKEWKKKLTKDDYVYSLLHLNKEISRHYDSSFEEEMKTTQERFGDMARELVDKELYKNPELMAGIMMGECFNYNIYGIVLSSYSKDKGVQKDVLEVLLDRVLHHETSRDGESLLVFFMLKVEDKNLLDYTYSAILNSEKKYLLPGVFAIKAEKDEKLALLFDLLDTGDLSLKDFEKYFRYRKLEDYDVKYVAGRLLDYGPEGAGIVLANCHNLLFGDNEPDEEYLAIGRRCLLLLDLNGIQMNDFVFLQSMNNYLVKHRDEEMALRIQILQEEGLKENYSRDNYFLGRLYRKVLHSYPELLKPRLFELLDEEAERHSWINLMRTSYPQEKNEEEPIYKLITEEEWFEWLKGDRNNNRAYTLAMIFNYTDGQGADPSYLRLINEKWCDEVRGALSSRFHSYGWSGSGIPLYKNRINICEDYMSKLTNLEAKEWFKRDIGFWEEEIEKEHLENAHERAIYD